MDAIDAYWSDGFTRVEGWVQSGNLPYLKHLDLLQRHAGITGEVAEIGVYHGKFLIALASFLPPGGKVTALDVFDDQSKNLDGAGEGNLDKLKQNVAAYGRADLDYAFIKADSSALTLLNKVELTRDRGPFRLFSVDGCHTAEHTLADLRTAQECLAPGGVIIVDDFMHPHWPGVTEAANIFLRDAPAVAPFLYAHHKLYLVGVGYHAFFHASFTEALGVQESARAATMFGRSVLSIYP